MSGSTNVLWSMFVLATFKFYFAAAPGAGLALPFYETVVVTSFGAIFSAAFFFYSGSVLFRWLQRKNSRKGITLNSRKFSRNRKILNIKLRIGFMGFCFLSSVLFPVPIGAMVCARFYRNHRLAFPLMVLGILVNANLLALIWYGIL